MIQQERITAQAEEQQRSLKKSESDFCDDNNNNSSNNVEPPIKVLLECPSAIERYTCVSILMGLMGVWYRWSFIDEKQLPDGIHRHIHSWLIPVGMTLVYLASLPLLRLFTERYLAKNYNMKSLLNESMILYNAIQVIVNIWMVYRIIDGVMFRGHSFVGGSIHDVTTSAPYAVYIHYCNKYLEYLDTYFMILRGKNDQVSFLHVYHHASIGIAWWIGLKLNPSGDIYFGALLNSWIHVMMYSYYTLSLLRINCPWKKYLTMAQLTQFLSVLSYSAYSYTFCPPGTHWKTYLGYSVQSFEMISLFVLFFFFYRKAYAKKPSKKVSSSDSDTSKVELESISSAGTDE